MSGERPQDSTSRATATVEAEAALVEMCENMVMQGDFLAKNDIQALELWFRTHGNSDISALGRLGATVMRIVADRQATEAEQEELFAAIEAVVTPEVRAALEAKQQR